MNGLYLTLSDMLSMEDYNGPPKTAFFSPIKNQGNTERGSRSMGKRPHKCLCLLCQVSSQSCCKLPVSRDQGFSRSFHVINIQQMLDKCVETQEREESPRVSRGLWIWTGSPLGVLQEVWGQIRGGAVDSCEVIRESHKWTHSFIHTSISSNNV